MAKGPDALDLVRGLDWSDKRVLVTGANSGIGVETARALAATGAEVFMACRTAATAEAARDDILSTHPQARLSILPLDLGDLDSVEACAAAYPHERLDRLVCNAGVYGGPYAQTAQGLERTVGVCHFGHFLLFARLIDKLRAAPSARVVMVSSENHRTPKRLRFEDFPPSRERYRDLVAYGQAKLCNALMAAEIQRRFGAEGIEACSLHPGALIGTDISRDSLMGRVMIALWRPFAKSVPQGAATTIHCAVTPHIDGGGYYADCAPKRATDEARSPEVAAKLWARSEELLEERGYALPW
jgi:WW domain-containing oxidoreductase